MQTNSWSNEGKKTLSEQAYESIREAILTLRLKPGQVVYESELASMLKMSRTPVREAVRILLVEEMMEVLPQRGMKVAFISETKVEETRYVREVLEVGSLRRVLEKWDGGEETFQHLQKGFEENLKLQRQAQRDQDFAKFLQVDELFHRLFLSATGNMTLISVVTQMRFHLNRVRVLTLEEFENVDDLIKEHEQVFEAVLAKDESRAIQILTNHLRRLAVDMHVIKQMYPSYFAQV